MMARRRKVPMIPVTVEPHIRPEAVRWWMDGVAKYEKKSMMVREEARKHMSAMGWKFWHAKLKGDKPVEFRYQSPAGKLYYSLKTACKACVELDNTGFESIGSNSSPNSPMEECNKEPKSCTSSAETLPKKRGRKKKIDSVVLKKRGRKRKIDIVMPAEEHHSSDVLTSDESDPSYYPMEDCKEAKSCSSLVQSKPKKRGRKRKIDLVHQSSDLLTSDESDPSYHPMEDCKEAKCTSLVQSEPKKRGRKRKTDLVHQSSDVLTSDGSDPSYHPMEDCKEAKSCTSLVQSEPKKRGRKRKTDLVHQSSDVLTSDGSDPSYHPMEDCKEAKSCTSLVQSKPKKRGRKRKIDLVTPEEQESLGISLKPGKVLAELKRIRLDDHPKVQIRSPRTILCSLIDNKIVMQHARVYYRGRRNGDIPLARGQVTREGIVCDCCSKVFALTAFEAHAGSTNHRPGANIILEEDWRAISDCQQQMKSFKDENKVIKKSSNKSDKIDDLCSVCHNEGELILCDRCPSSFHTGCLGLSEVADGNWFCPACCCGICGSGNLEEGTIPGEIRKCDQCERRYHLGCLNSTGLISEENWFCSSKCQNIQFGLKGRLGQPILVGDNNLTWTLLKSSNNRSHSREIQKKLRFALNVLHKCFEPSVDPYTQRDLVEDIVLNKESNLRRLNFRGFYTVVLERNKEVLCVATVRIYGDVAEVPLVATMFQHRRLGMCRILMSELEKQLTKLGVERLVLPSAPAALDTWTNTSIGFSEMPAAEKPQFVNYFFLYFQGTILCHKFLKQNGAAIQATIPEENMELDESSGGISTITEAEE